MIANGSLTRQIGVFLIGLATITFISHGLTAKCLLVPADFNNSGSTNVADVTCHILSIQASIKGNALPECLQVAEDAIDLNCDDSLNVVDVQLSILLVLGPPLGIKWPKSLDADGDYCVDACPPADPPANPDCSSHPGILTHLEDFEDGADGWSTGAFHFNGTNSWMLMTMAGGDTELALPSVMFGVPNSGEEAGYEASYLESPVFDLTGGGAIVFDTYSANENNDPYDAESLLVSYDGGVTWETLIESSRQFWVQYGYDGNEETVIVPGQVSAIIPADKGTSTTVFRFAYNTVDGCCGSGNVVGWYIDNVKLYSTTTVCYFESCGAESGVCADGQCIAATDLGPNNNQEIIGMTCSDPAIQNYIGGSSVDILCDYFNNDPDGCATAFMTDSNSDYAPRNCYYDADTESCLLCSIDNGGCTNTCLPIVAPAAPPISPIETDIVCEQDSSRIYYVGGWPGENNVCHNYDGDPTACNLAFHSPYYGGAAASCWYDEETSSCRGCGGGREPSGQCVNTCDPADISCPDAPELTDYVGDDQQWSPCHIYDGNETACNSAYHLARNIYGAPPQPASCYWVAEENACRGCGKRGLDGQCTNQCITPEFDFTCDQHPELADFVGGSGQNACQVYNGNETACLNAFHYSQEIKGPAPCYWDPDASEEGECRGCGRNFADGDCTLSCSETIECAQFPELTANYLPGNGNNACHVYDGDEAGCLTALHFSDTFEGPAPCYWDPDGGEGGECRGCGNNYFNGQCDRVCEGFACDAQPQLTDFVGGNGNNACHTYDGNESACLTAFHYAGDLNAPAPCYWDPNAGEGGQCRGCGNNFFNGICNLTCSGCTFTTPGGGGD
ncbi:MAG: hypothetical protein HUU55_11675 [Myxococcales bacterium]|nr:hypothetical protein [Myxococcales bacterium]